MWARPPLRVPQLVTWGLSCAGSPLPWAKLRSRWALGLGNSSVSLPPGPARALPTASPPHGPPDSKEHRPVETGCWRGPPLTQGGEALL